MSINKKTLAKRKPKAGRTEMSEPIYNEEGHSNEEAKDTCGPYRAFFPLGSNGYAEVLDANDRMVCTSYVNGMERALLIAAALNAYELKP